MPGAGLPTGQKPPDPFCGSSLHRVKKIDSEWGRALDLGGDIEPAAETAEQLHAWDGTDGL